MVGLVIESGDVWEVHHYATLLSFGANAVNPYLAFATIKNLRESNSSPNIKKLKTLKIKFVQL